MQRPVVALEFALVIRFPVASIPVVSALDGAVVVVVAVSLRSVPVAFLPIALAVPILVARDCAPFVRVRAVAVATAPIAAAPMFAIL